MASEESSKQAAILADSGVVQGQDSLRSTDLYDLNVKELKSGETFELGADANEGASARFAEPTAPSFRFEVNRDFVPTGDPGRDYGPLTGIRAPHPSYWRGPRGEMLSPPVSRELAQTAYDLAKENPSLEDELMSIASVYAVGERDILTKEELQEADDGGILEFIGTAFEGFDAPRRLLWQGVAWGGQALPDPGTMVGDAVQSVVGVVGGLALGAIIGNIETSYSPISAVGSIFDDEELEENPVYPVIPGQEMVDGFNQMAQNLYGSIATGELHEKALDRVRPWLWHGSTEARVLSGDMLIDAMLTREQAYEMSLDESKAPHLRAFARHVATDTGRLAYGVLAEFVVDPLWFFGPAKFVNSRKAVKLIDGVETTLTVMPPLGHASGSMNLLAKGKKSALTARGYDDVMATIVVGNADDSRDAALLVGKYAEIAEAGAISARKNTEELAIILSSGDSLKPATIKAANLRFTEASERANRFLAMDRKDTFEAIMGVANRQREEAFRWANDPIAAKRYLHKEVKRLAFTAKTFTKHRDNINFGLRAATSSRATGKIDDVLLRTGFGSWHIPFTSKMGYVFKSGPLDSINKTIQASPRAAKFIDDYSMASLEGRMETARLKMTTGEMAPTAEMVFAGDRGAYFAYGMQKAAGKAIILPGLLWGIMAKAIGTRHIQPMVQVLSEEAYNAAGHLTAVPFSGKFLAKMKRVDPKIWENFQDAITEFSTAFAGLEMDLRAGWVRLISAGSKALAARKKNKKKKLTELRRRLDASTDLADKTEIRREIEEVNRWGTKQYTLDHVLMDAADADERQLGMFGFLSDEIKAVAAETKALVNSVVNNPEVKAGRLQVEQALVAMIRKARGDKERGVKLLAQLDVINKGLERVSNFRDVQKVKAQKALLARVTQLRSLREGIENIDSDVLVETLEKLRSIRETGVYDEAVHAEHIFNFIKERTKSDIAARQILRRFALGMGEAEGGTALAKLLVRLTGSFEYSSDVKKVGFSQAMQNAVNGYLSELHKEYKILSKAYRDGDILHDGSRLSVGGSELSLTTGNADIPGMTRKEFKMLVSSMIDENDTTWKLMVPESEHQAFKQWIDGTSELTLDLDKPKRKRKRKRKFEDKVEPKKGDVVAPESHRQVVIDSIRSFISENTVTPEVPLPGVNLAQLKGLIAHLSSDPTIESKYLGLLAYLDKHIGDDILVALMKPGDSRYDKILKGEPGMFTRPDRAEGQIPRTIFITDSLGADTAIPIMEVVAHEVLHAATVTRFHSASKEFADGIVSVSSKASDDIRKLFNFAVEHANKEGLPDPDSTAGFFLRKALTSPEEMMAYGMTNDHVYHWLDSIAYKPKAKLSVLHVLIEKIKRLFGKATKDGAAAELSKHIDNLLRGPDPTYFPGINETFSMSIKGKQGDLFPTLKGVPGTKEHAVSKAARTKAVQRADRLAKRKTSGRKEKVFNFEPSEKSHWNQARTYYERIAHLKTVSKNTRRFTTKQSVELAKARLGILKPIHSWTKHERYRIQEELRGTGVRLWSRFLIDQDHAWYFTKPRPKIKKPPVEAKVTVAPPKEPEAPEPTEAPEVATAPEVIEQVEAKPTPVPTTEAAQASHQASTGGLVLKEIMEPKPKPRKDYVPSERGGRHVRGVGTRSGTYRNRSDDRVFQVKKIKTVAGEHFAAYEKVKGAEDVRVFPKRKFVSQSSAQEFLKKIDDEAMPEGRLVVKVKYKTKSMTVEQFSPTRKSYNVWTDPNTNKDYFFFSESAGKKRAWTVKDGEGNTIFKMSPVIENGKVTKGVPKAEVELALEERLNVLDGSLPETEAVAEVVSKVAAEAAEAGDVFVEPIVLSQLDEEISGAITLSQMKEAGYTKYTKGYKPEKDDVIAIFTSAGTNDLDHYRIIESIKLPDELGHMRHEITLVDHAGNLDDTGFIEDIFELDEIMIMKKGAKSKPKSKTQGLSLKSGAANVEPRAAVAAASTKTKGGLSLKSTRPAAKPAASGLTLKSGKAPSGGLTLKSAAPELPASLERGVEKYFHKVKRKDKVNMYPKVASSQKALRKLGWNPYEGINIFKGDGIVIYKKKATGHKLDYMNGGTVVGEKTVPGKDHFGNDIDKTIFTLEDPNGLRTELHKEQIDDVFYTEQAGDTTDFRVYKVKPSKVKLESEPLSFDSIQEAEDLGFKSAASESGAYRKLPPETDIAVFEDGIFKAGGTVVSADMAAYTLSGPKSTVSVAELTRLSRGGEKGDPGVVVLVKRPEVKTVASEPADTTKFVASRKREPLIQEGADMDDFMETIAPRTEDPGPRPFDQQKALRDYNDAVAAYKNDKDILAKKRLAESFDKEYRNLITEDMGIPRDEVGTSPAEVLDDIHDTLVNLNNSILDNRAITDSDLIGLDELIDDIDGMMGHALSIKRVRSAARHYGGAEYAADTYYRYFLNQKSWKATKLHEKLVKHAKKFRRLGKKFLTKSDARQRYFHENLHKLADGILTSDFDKIAEAKMNLVMGRDNKWASQFPTSGTFLMAGKDKPFFHPNMLKEHRIKEALKGKSPEDTAEALLHIINKGNTIDPMVAAILKKALKKYSTPLKQIFNSPDAFLSKNLERELSTLKSDITKFMKTPDGPLTDHRQISKFISPVSKRGLGLKEGKDHRVYTDTALGGIHEGTRAERVPKMVRTKALIKRYEDRREALEKYMGETKPHFGKRPDELPGDSIDPNYRPLENWEMILWDDYDKIATKYGLTDLDKLQAVFTVLRETPKIVNKDMYPELAKLYPSLLGNRYGDDLDPTLVPAMIEMRKIIDRYQLEYKKRDYSWVASPERIMREWGVLSFVPHIYKEMDLNKTRQIMLGKVFSGGGSGIDQVLWMGKPADKTRELIGSISELNAMISPNHDKVLTLDPTEIWARYTQMNRSMTNEDFLLTILDTGVAKFLAPIEELDEAGKVIRIITPEEQAAKLDLVELFGRPNKKRSADLLHRGDRRAWLESGMSKKDVEEFVLGDEPVGVFASYLNTSPKVRMMRKVQQAILRVRGEQFHAGSELLVDPAKTFRSMMDPIKAREEAAWDLTRGVELRSGGSVHSEEAINLIRRQEVDDIVNSESVKVWEKIAGDINKEIVKYGVVAPKLNAGLLKNFFSQRDRLAEAWIPRAVKHQMREVLEMGDDMAKGPIGQLKKASDLVQAWWKTRVTVTSVAFSSRNAVSNAVSNMLDLGVMGALSPRTNLLATQISAALLIKEEYGSIGRFLDEAAKKEGALGNVSEFLKGGKDLPLSLRRLYNNGVDFGNGIVMDLEEVLEEMVGSGVLSPAFTQFSDIGRAEMSALEQFAEGGAIRRLLSKKYGKDITGLAGGLDIEDGVIVMLGMGISGGIPVALPKNFGGKHLARVVENQARAANFIANFRQKGVWADAAAHSNKFLFDYGDLTQFQRQVMRSIFPFFTWSIKNIHLQFEMMQKSPHFYATFHRLMSDGVPQIFESTQAEDGYIKSDPIDIEMLRLKQSHYRHSVSIPLPSLEGTGFGNIPVPVLRRKPPTDKFRVFDFDVGTGTLAKDYFPTLKGAKIQGLGLPQEALVSNLSTAAALFDPRNTVGTLLPDALGGKTARARIYSDRNRLARVMGEVHFLLRAASELTTRRHSFYDKDIAELTDGRLVNEILRPLDAIPLVGGPMKAYMHNVTGLRTYTYYDKFNKRFRTKVNVHGLSNYMLGTFPWMRNFRDAAAATEMFYAQKMLPLDELIAGGAKARDMHTVPFSWSIMDSLSGAGVSQIDLDLQKTFARKRLEDMYLEQLHALGVLKTFDQDYIPYK